MADKSTSPAIMVVEDDPIVSALLVHTLLRRGFTVDVAPDGRRAVEMLDGSQPADLVLLDVMLPYLDGFELIDRIRRKADWADVPIIMLTSKSQEDSVVRALEAGASDYVVKPFRPEELVARVRRCLRVAA